MSSQTELPSFRSRVRRAALLALVITSASCAGRRGGDSDRDFESSIEADLESEDHPAP